jgi:predicted nuclease with TOPRIM domain
MRKFLDADTMDEVEAFTKEELDAQIAKAVEAKGKEFEKTIAEKEVEVTTLSEKLTKRGEEYNNLKTKLKEVETASATGTEEITKARDEFRDGLINKLAGDDKEYKEALKAQSERLGFDTLDVTKAEVLLKEAHALALNSLNREFVAFDMAGVSTGGKAPETSKTGDQDKATDAQIAAVNEALGQAPVIAGEGMTL